MAKRWFYSGDMSIRHGGMFYNLSNWQDGYVDAVRVTPCSDAGGPDNLFWVEGLTVNLRNDPKELRDILNTCGYDMDDMPKGAARKHLLVEAHVAHGTYDQTSSRVVQIGPDDPFCPEHIRREFSRPADARLRADASLRRYVRRLATNEEF